MFAVIKTGGKQYKVAVNDVIKVEKIPGDAGDTATFDTVLMHGGDGGAVVGTPSVAGAVVTGEILEQFRDKKVIAFKKRRRKHSSMTKKGHRQYLTAVRIKGIPGDEDGSKSGAAKKASAPKAEKASSPTSAEDVTAKNMDDYTRPENFLDAPVEDGDDLTKLPGLGVASQKQLNEMGIYYYRQFKEFSTDDWDYVEAYIETQLEGRVKVDRPSIMVQIKKLLDE